MAASELMLDHDDNEDPVAREFHPRVFVRSFHFFDPDGVLLEFAAWTRQMDLSDDLGVDPVDATGTHVSA